MEFRANLVVGKKNPNAIFAMAGAAGLIVSVAFSVVHRYQYYGLWGSGVSLLVLIVGAAMAKGDLTFVMVAQDQDLVVNEDSIRIGEERYPLDKADKIVFNVEGYDGMVDEGNTNSRGNPIYLNGMGNYLSFVFEGKKVECAFYLAGPQSVQQMGVLFRDWYSRQVVFEERTGTGRRTFMFEPVSNEELKDRLVAEGYVRG